MLQQTSEREQQLGRAVEGAEQWMLKAQAATRQAEKLTAAVEREAEYVGRRALELQATAQQQQVVARVAASEREAAGEVQRVLSKAETELAAAQTKIEELENPPAAEEGEGDAAPAE